MPVQSKASCFIDACEIAFACNARVIAMDYKALCGEVDHDPDVEGYHTSIVNMCMLERFGRALTIIDCRPTIDDKEFAPNIPGYVSDWFKRPELRAVVTGVREDGSHHALAFRDGHFIDTNGEVLGQEPNMKLIHVWVFGLPAFDGEKDVDKA